MHALITGEKTSKQIEAMRTGGRIIAMIFDEIRQFVHADMTEKDIDRYVATRIMHYGATPTYKEPKVNFPGVICISTNDQVVHGVPTDYVLQRGDVVSFDMVITYDGMKTDSGFTLVVDDEPRGAVKHLINTTERALFAGIDAIKGPVMTGDISAAIEKILRAGKLGIVRELVGHGVGFDMHMPPDVPNYGQRGKGVLLQPGDTIAIEPITTLGSEKIYELDDGWTIATRDGSLSAYAEHTVLVTEYGAEILTIA